jgi:hypothetical protein
MRGQLNIMKTIAMLGICAALALAMQPDDKKAPEDKKAADPKLPGAASATAKPGRPAVAAAPSQAAKRKLHQPTVTPAEVKLTPQQQAAAALPTVPPEAKEAGPNLFRYTDPQGKRWMYRKTPFGVSKWEEKPEDQEPHAESPSSGTTVTDLGDSVRFQRATPFGPQIWTRKKSEMTDDEKAAFATQEHAKQSVLGSKPADGAKPPEQH